MNRVFVTTPIFYVNGAPHLGHAYSLVLADVIARWHRLNGARVLLATGTDEHGKKVHEAAQSANMTTMEFCTHNSNCFRSLALQLDCSQDDFIRTTESRHVESVHRLWDILQSKGYLYRGSYSGWYSVSDEEFLKEEDTIVLEDGSRCSKLSGRPVELISELNWMFKLSAFRDEIKSIINSGKMQIVPASRKNEVLAYLDSDIGDLSVSRPVARVPWGIPVPSRSFDIKSADLSDDDRQVIYVWLDALANYLTVAGYPSPRFVDSWPPTHQVIGKDILKFHAVYWPAFLLAADLPFPKKIVCHAHWVVDGKKMSKSLGNVVEPCKYVDSIGMDRFRYFMMKESSLSQDSNFLRDLVFQKCNVDLADTLGNLLSRTLALLAKTDREALAKQFFKLANPFVSQSAQETEIFSRINNLRETVHVYYDDGEISKVIEHILELLRLGNSYFSAARPWDTVKPGGDFALFSRTLLVSLEVLRASMIALSPIIPISAEKGISALAAKDLSSAQHVRFGLPFSFSIDNSLNRILSMNVTQPLFARLKSTDVCA
ncbi:mitochondrial methionyl-tRNA synthetase (MetRS) [Andalucia godoyi]|uniref:methionine--tRNA ligase n=1 Tax=Andalucia godoyi TaxID=505711 RepID=A0A8K0F0W7_ANDGO|nr:mitochondrial methionyl-tRNA synthetase (MetRS) [Andalucia godoyi]|eukprot:ANDGO_05701.mRNA.1 mitochondrial methionyl-tRNA synthetase (MetRS)